MYLPGTVLAIQYQQYQHTTEQNAFHSTQSTLERQGDEDFDAVGENSLCAVWNIADDDRGLDNAGKTTIVKKIMNEDVNSVSPTLGFIIKTIEYDGYGREPILVHTKLTTKDTN